MAKFAKAPDVLAGSALARRKGGHGRRVSCKPVNPIKPKTPKQVVVGGSLARHDFAVVFRQLVVLLLVALAAFVVAMPVSTAAIPDASVFNLDYTHDQLKFRFWLESLTYPIVLGAAVFGVSLGMRAFRFLLVKCESTAVLSLPLSRATVFTVRYGACLLALAVGIGLPLLASLVVNVVALNVWMGLTEQFLYVFGGLFLTAALACTVACIACALAGTLAEALAFAVAVLSGVSVVAWGLNAIMEWMLVGNAAGVYLSNGTTLVALSLVDAGAALNPLLFFVQQATVHQTFMVQHPVYYPEAGNWLLVAGWAATLVVLALCALVLMCRRKGEKAGIAGLNGAIMFVVGMVVGLAAFGATFTMVAKLNVAAAVVTAFAVFLAASAVFLRGPLKGVAPLRRTMAMLVAEVAGLACVLVVVATGGLGFSQAVPAVGDVSSVEVSYTGSPSYLAAKFDTAKAGDGSYYFSTSYTFHDAAAVQIVHDIHERLITTASLSLAEDRMDMANTILPYDLVVRYQMTDGSKLVRYYNRASLSELAALLQLDATASARELARATIAGDRSLLDDTAAAAINSSPARQAYALGDIYLSDRLYASPMLVNCDAQARTELLAALAQDVAGQDVQDRYHPSGTCQGVLMFTQTGDVAAETFSYGLENTLIYLSDEFKQTLAWFKSKGLLAYLQTGGAAAGLVQDKAALAASEAASVETLTFQRFAPYEGMNAPTNPQSAYFMGYRATVAQQFITMQDFGTKFSTNDEEQIAELLPLARNDYYLDGGGYLVSAKLKGQQAYAYLFIPAADAPEWLVRVAG